MQWPNPKKISRNDYGFTLVELTIIISIIAILGTISTIVYGNVIKNNRDQTRLRDLGLVSEALELYRGDAGNYPRSQATPQFQFDCISAPPVSNGSKVYMEKTPNDSKCPDRTYVYKALPENCDNTVTGCTGYLLCSKKEGTNTLNNPDGECNILCGPDGNCDFGLKSR